MTLLALLGLGLVVVGVGLVLGCSLFRLTRWVANSRDRKAGPFCQTEPATSSPANEHDPARGGPSHDHPESAPSADGSPGPIRRGTGSRKMGTHETGGPQVSALPLVIPVPATPTRKFLMLDESPPLNASVDGALGELHALVRSADKESRRIETDLEQAIVLGLATCCDFPDEARDRSGAV